MAVQDGTLTKTNVCSSGLIAQSSESRDHSNGDAKSSLFSTSGSAYCLFDQSNCIQT